jgi:hypothetical protein
MITKIDGRLEVSRVLKQLIIQGIVCLILALILFISSYFFAGYLGSAKITSLYGRSFSFLSIVFLFAGLIISIATIYKRVLFNRRSQQVSNHFFENNPITSLAKKILIFGIAIASVCLIMAILGHINFMKNLNSGHYKIDFWDNLLINIVSISKYLSITIILSYLIVIYNLYKYKIMTQ